jgi:pimeloyl-ACP methyl ester carboxylesterase
MAKPPPLDRVHASTLLVRGRDSEVVPEPLADVVLETMSSCKLVTVPGGHIVMWDAFDETADAVLAFLQDSRA